MYSKAHIIGGPNAFVQRCLGMRYWECLEFKRGVYCVLVPQGFGLKGSGSGSKP